MKREGKINGDQEGCRLGLKPAPDERTTRQKVPRNLAR